MNQSKKNRSISRTQLISILIWIGVLIACSNELGANGNSFHVFTLLLGGALNQLFLLNAVSNNSIATSNKKKGKLID